MACPRSFRHRWAVVLVAVFSPLPPIAMAQESAEQAGFSEATNKLPAPTTGDLFPASAKVDVNPVAVANRIEVVQLSPCWSWPCRWGAGVLMTRGSRIFLRHRVRVNLQRQVIARGIGALVFLVGRYVR